MYKGSLILLGLLSWFVHCQTIRSIEERKDTKTGTLRFSPESERFINAITNKKLIYKNKSGQEIQFSPVEHRVSFTTFHLTTVCPITPDNETTFGLGEYLELPQHYFRFYSVELNTSLQYTIFIYIADSLPALSVYNILKIQNDYKKVILPIIGGAPCTDYIQMSKRSIDSNPELNLFNVPYPYPLPSGQRIENINITYGGMADFQYPVLTFPFPHLSDHIRLFQGVTGCVHVSYYNSEVGVKAFFGDLQNETWILDRIE